MVLLPPPQTARGGSEDGGDGAAESMRVPDVAGRQQQPTLTRAQFGRTWYSASSRLPAKPWPSVSTWEAGEADPSQPLVLALLASRQPDRVPAPGELGLTLRFSSAVTQVPRKGLSCTWAPLALEPAALGAEGAAGTVSPTPVRTRTPCQVEGGGESREDAGLHACPEHTGTLHRWGRLLPRPSQLRLLIGGLPCRPSHSSPAGQ